MSNDESMFEIPDFIFKTNSSKDTDEVRLQKKLKEKESEIKTSYILVNALLHLLIEKGIIYPHELQAIVSELHEKYLKEVRGEM